MSPCHLHRNMEWADSFGLLGSCQGNDNINTVFDGNMVWCAWKAARSGWTISRRGERAGWGGRAHREQQKDELEKPKLIYFLFLFLDQPPSRCLLSLVAFFFSWILTHLPCIATGTRTHGCGNNPNTLLHVWHVRTCRRTCWEERERGCRGGALI